LGKASLILRVSLAISNAFCFEKAYTYNFFGSGGDFFLKNFEISLISFEDLARMGEERVEMYEGLIGFLFLSLLMTSLPVC